MFKHKGRYSGKTVVRVGYSVVKVVAGAGDKLPKLQLDVCSKRYIYDYIINFLSVTFCDLSKTL